MDQVEFFTEICFMMAKHCSSTAGSVSHPDAAGHLNQEQDSLCSSSSLIFLHFHDDSVSRLLLQLLQLRLVLVETVFWA